MSTLLRWLELELPLERLAALLREFGGQRHLSLPRWETYNREIRDAQILLAAEDGVSAQALATQYRLTERHVRRIVEAGRTSPSFVRALDPTLGDEGSNPP